MKDQSTYVYALLTCIAGIVFWIAIAASLDMDYAVTQVTFADAAVKAVRMPVASVFRDNSARDRLWFLISVVLGLATILIRRASFRIGTVGVALLVASLPANLWFAPLLAPAFSLYLFIGSDGEMWGEAWPAMSAVGFWVVVSLAYVVVQWECLRGERKKSPKNGLCQNNGLAACCLVGLLALPGAVHAQEADQQKKANQAKAAPTYDASVPEPTLTGVRYGEHERHILDFWKAPSDTPTPLVFVIHGGGWKGGSKERLHRFVEPAALLEAGISVVAINYRLMAHAQEVDPPVKAPLHDAARALQFVRSKADEWNIDKARIGAAGGSAGACSSLWLAYHDDLADPESNDPVARESTRLWCAAVKGPQTTLDPKQMKEWTPNSKYGGHAFGKDNFAQFLAERDSVLPWIAEYSPYSLVNAGDPPSCLFYGSPPAVGENQKDPTHTANFGVKLQERCKEVGVQCEVVYPGVPDAKYETPTEHLIAALKASAGE